jgi:hypothetical protein
VLGRDPLRVNDQWCAGASATRRTFALAFDHPNGHVQANGAGGYGRSSMVGIVCSASAFACIAIGARFGPQFLAGIGSISEIVGEPR